MVVQYYPNKFEASKSASGINTIATRRLCTFKLKFDSKVKLPEALRNENFSHAPSVTMKFGEKKSLQIFVTWWNQMFIEEFDLNDEKDVQREKVLMVDN